ncbi:YxlC family protein [Paenibacillus sp. GCM10027626]|uniref:YxlC family protein n=1 Tax=Paenibacillus sp. GCM10027626 TaxID=3273411 RepID=UPI00363873ED
MKRNGEKKAGTPRHEAGHRQHERLEEEEELFQRLLGQPLQQWDEAIKPDVPSIQALTQLTQQHRSDMRRKLWRDLVLLWIVSGVLLSGLLILVQEDIRLFVIVQVTVFAAALLFLVGERVHREVRRKWTN